MTRSRHTQNVPSIFLLILLITALAGGDPTMAQELEERRAGADDANALVGVWESVAASQIDCQTGQPLPDAPIIRSAYTIHPGGTMSEVNTDPIEGPYRSSGFGIWKRGSGRHYAAAYQHYGFVDQNLTPTKQLGAVVKARTSIRLSRDATTFVETGTFLVFFPDPVTSELGDPIFSGCFAATAHRLTF
jgi:hypothetical protein